MGTPWRSFKQRGKLKHSCRRRSRWLVLGSFRHRPEFCRQGGRLTRIEAGVVVGIHADQQRIENRLCRHEGAEGAHIRPAVELLNHRTIELLDPHTDTHCSIVPDPPPSASAWTIRKTIGSCQASGETRLSSINRDGTRTCLRRVPLRTTSLKIIGYTRGTTPAGDRQKDANHRQQFPSSAATKLITAQGGEHP